MFALNYPNLPMKNLIVISIATFAFTIAMQAGEVTAKLSGVHLCCPSCVKGVNKAVDGIQGVTATASEEQGIVTLTGADTATVQKAADALTAAGYFGKSSDPAIKLNAETGAKGKNVQSLEVANVHLCCGKC